MKIGILTLPLHTNYGGILQAYALQTVLESMGHEVVVFQREIKPLFKIPLWKMPLSYTKRILIKLFVNRKQIIFIERRNRRDYPYVRQHTNRFIKQNIHVANVEKLFDIDLETIDCIVVGSDQIWRPFHVNNLWKSSIQSVFLDFAKKWDGKKIAYAASFGVDEWEMNDKETADCRALAQLFDGVSVREESGIILCMKYLSIDAKMVLDPTLLLPADHYRSFIKSGIENKKNELFYYILDETEEKMQLVTKVANDCRLVPFTTYIDEKKVKWESADKRTIRPVEDWLRGFDRARFVVTDSFHGCVFSIIFQKPFIVIGNAERGNARFYSLLKCFHLEDHLIMDITEYDSACSYSMPENVVPLLLNWKQRSLDFIREHLK